MSVRLENQLVSGRLVDKDASDLAGLLQIHGFDTTRLVKVPHSYSLATKKRTEVKTDLICESTERRISIKEHKPIQLCSVGGETASFYFKTAQKNANLTKCNQINNLNVSAQLWQKKMSKNESFLWNLTQKEKEKRSLLSALENNPSFKRELIKIALTGEGIFENSRAIANWVATPEKVTEITDDYIKKVSDNAKIDIRLKSRKGVSEVNLRIDVNMRKL
tara:strand:- start:1344 stop:2003 length:660 start_codon:yes stop_codon:yes gene_type:complete